MLKQSFVIFNFDLTLTHDADELNTAQLSNIELYSWEEDMSEVSSSLVYGQNYSFSWVTVKTTEILDSTVHKGILLSLFVL